MPSKKKIAYNETLSYLGGRGSKTNPIILHLINGTFIMGGVRIQFCFEITEKINSSNIIYCTIHLRDGKNEQ